MSRSSAMKLLLLPLIGAVAALNPSKGCNNPSTQLSAGPDKQVSVTEYDGVNLRNYTLYLPQNYDPQVASPLVITFHGLGLNPAVHLAATRWNDSSLNPSYVVAAPLGRNNSWQGYYDKPPGADDIAFTLKLVDTLSNGLCIDQDRIYANGFSNGGGFTNTLACTPRASNKFAAFGMVSGAFWHGSEAIGTAGNDNPRKEITGCLVNRANTPIFEVHGGMDARIIYNGDETAATGPDTGVEEGDVYPPIQQWLSRWSSSARNNCSYQTARESPSPYPNVRFYHFGPSCNVRHYNVTYAGHGAWVHNGPNGLDVTRDFVTFFDKFSLA